MPAATSTKPVAAEPTWKQPEGPRSGTHQLGDGLIAVTIHHYIGYPPETWLVTCRAVGVDRRELKSTDVDAAKAEAIEVVRAALRDLTAKLHQLVGVAP